jgi:hypothetical protein
MKNFSRCHLLYFTYFVILLISLTSLTSNAQAQDVKITGTSVFTYTHNNNHPKQHGDQYAYADNSNSDNVYLFNGRAGNLRMTYSALQFRKESRKGRVGFNITVLDGEADSGYTRGDVYSNTVQDAYLIIPIQRRRKEKPHLFELGGFVSPIGYERPQMDNLISRSYQYQLTQPFTLFGLRTVYKQDTELYYLMQFDGVSDYLDIDTGKQKGLLFRHKLVLSPQKNLSVTGLIGQYSKYEYSGYSNLAGYGSTYSDIFPPIYYYSSPRSEPRRTVGMLDVVYSLQKSEKTQIMLDAIINRQETDAGAQTRAAIGGYYLQAQNNGDLLTLRGEYVNPSQDAGFKRVRSLTAAYQFKKPLISLVPRATTVLELRLDKSDTLMFFHGKSRTRKDQATLAVSQVVKF